MVNDVVKCPYCGFEGEFRLLKTWKYRWWNVYFYECPNCCGRFRYQVDPAGKYKSYVMKLGVYARGKGGGN
jgi:uncharacterized Zn finger protein